MPRIVTLLPSATEIVGALGARASLVGRSHECDFPAGLELEGVPVLTRARLDGLPRATAPSPSTKSTSPALERARPDVVVTQDLCDVCAVGVEDVRSALSRLSRRDVALVSLHPRTLADVLEDVRSVAAAIGRDERELVTALTTRIEAVRRRAAGSSRPRVLTLEWLAPVMVGGLWMPELIELAGGTPLVTRAGEMAPALGRAELEALDPDVVLVKPCGYDLARAVSEVALLRERLPWERWARAGVRTYVTDGNAYFNRSGPRLVESLEILAACLDAPAFPDFVARHAGSVRRVSPGLEVLPAFTPP